MHQQLKYALLFLTLTLFGFTSLGHSQDTVEQPDEKLGTTEQSTEEPNPSAVQVKNLEARLGTLEGRFVGLENSVNDLGNRSTNWFLISAVILLAVLILSFNVHVFLRSRKVQQESQESDAKVQDLEKQLVEKTEEFQENLTSVRQSSLNNTEKLNGIESEQSLISEEQRNIHNTVAEIRQRIDYFELNLANLESDIKTDDAIDYQSEAKIIVQEAQEQVSELARAYREGGAIDFIKIESPTPSQQVHLIARLLHQWKIELERSGEADLLQSLTYPEEILKDRLKTIRGESTPAPQSLDLDTHISTDTELHDIRNQCLVYIAQFEGILWGYELGHKVDEASHAQFIPQFIKDQLFNNVARSIRFDQPPGQLNKFLQLVDYEIVSIEVGKTIVNAREHDIQDSQQTGVKHGTVAEVVLPGLRRKTDGTIVQKPVVIRGE